MAVTAVGIANSALIKVGADPISSLTQDTRSANLIHAIYEQLRDEVQSAHPWNFTLTRVTLAPNADVPDFGYTTVYDLPNDYLTLWETDPDDLDYVIESNQILCNETDSIDVIYGGKNTDESKWSHLFGEALAWRIAMEVSYALTESLNLMDFCSKAYMKTLSEAKWRDGIESPIKGLVADKWTNSRQ